MGICSKPKELFTLKLSRFYIMLFKTTSSGKEPLIWLFPYQKRVLRGLNLENTESG
jgi:hypothetical protein